nr:MAG TPA: hypothetical protein [Caudoviricetes sp.]
MFSFDGYIISLILEKVNNIFTKNRDFFLDN